MSAGLGFNVQTPRLLRIVIPPVPKNTPPSVELSSSRIMSKPRPNSAPVRTGSPLLAWFRMHVKTPCTAMLLASFTLWSFDVKAANLVWDRDGVTGGATGGTGNWDTTSLFWDNAGTMESWINAFNYAYFGGTAGVVTVTEPVQTGGLNFSTSGYRLTGGTITLAAPAGTNSPVIAVNNNGFGTNEATISSILAGTSGFTKTGNGTLRLTADNSATLSGDIAIKGGSVVITNANQLGSLTGTVISVTGIANTAGAAGSAGFTGGALVLQGSGVSAGSTAGVTLNREVSIAGRGPGANNLNGPLVSIGYNP